MRIAVPYCEKIRVGLEKPRLFGIFLGFYVFFNVFKVFFIVFLGFNVHNAEHRYMTHDK